MARISADSHIDHGLSEAQTAFVMGRIYSLEVFTILTITLPERFGKIMCGLHGPIMGDPPVTDVIMQVRGNRVGESRMTSLKSRQTDQLTVIVGPHNGEIILYTAFGGPATPREPFDPSLNEEERVRSVEFWSKHALSL
jgi:hypothetical protein